MEQKYGMLICGNFNGWLEKRIPYNEFLKDDIQLGFNIANSYCSNSKIMQCFSFPQLLIIIYSVCQTVIFFYSRVQTQLTLQNRNAKNFAYGIKSKSEQ